MLNNRIANFMLMAVLTALLCVSNAYAQQEDDSQNPPAAQYSSTIVDGGPKVLLNFTIKTLGSVTIQVRQKDHEHSTKETRSLSDFRVRLRSRDEGFETWHIDQFTNADGTHTFERLPPGKYVIELDPADLWTTGVRQAPNFVSPGTK